LTFLDAHCGQVDGRSSQWSPRSFRQEVMGKYKKRQGMAQKKKACDRVDALEVQHGGLTASATLRSSVWRALVTIRNGRARMGVQTRPKEKKSRGGGKR